MNLLAFRWGRMAVVDAQRVEAAVKRASGRVVEARVLSAEARALVDGAGVAGEARRLLEVRVPELIAYQNAAYARQYVDFVQRVAAEEQRRVPGRTGVTEAVARHLFKLMAYKDEYEVARLYTDGAFQKQLESEFEGDYKLVLHLAPPRMPVLDWFLDRRVAGSDRMKKIAFGRWIFTFLRVLARFKFLRGTALDPFGRGAHRRLERQLAVEYAARVEELCEGLSEETLDVAVEIASLPEHVRGFESVKEDSLEAVGAKQQELLAAFRLKSGAAA
jgi:indolepyruvate ferredoxin oxidoreductase